MLLISNVAKRAAFARGATKYTLSASTTAIKLTSFNASQSQRALHVLKAPRFTACSSSSASAPSSSSSGFPSYGSEENYLKASLATDIPTVKLAFDKFSEYKKLAEPSQNNGTKGANSPIVILHGLFGSKSNNRTVAKQLSGILNRDVYCLDLRNHGESEHSPRHDYPALAADVERFLEDEGIVPKQQTKQEGKNNSSKGKPIIIGHSMGAKTAMAISLRRPDLPKLVISVDNAPITYQYSSGSKFARYVRALIDITEGHGNGSATSTTTAAVTSRTQADEKLAKIEPELGIRQFLLTNVLRKSKQEVIDEFEEHQKDKKDKKIYKDIGSVPVFKSKVPLRVLGKAIDAGNIAVWPFDSKFNKWSGPMLFIRGSKSNYVSDDVLPEVGRFFPKFEVKDVDAGHWLISEKPKEFVEIVRDWIELKEEVMEDQENGKQGIF